MTPAFFDSITDSLKERIDDNQGVRVSGRLTWLPYYDEPSNGRYLVHTGIGIMHTEDQDNRVRFRSRPQIHEGPRLIDSGVIPAERYTTGNLEGAVVWGRVTVQSEVFLSNVDLLDGGYDTAHGGYAHLSYFLTGENRIYERFGQHGAQFGRNVPYTNVFATPCGCGWGAWELKGRYSHLNLNNFDAGQWFPSRPWNAIGWTPLAIFPFIVGLGYLLPVDLLFSCWFFFLFWRLEKVGSSALGYAAEQPKFPYIDEQMFGAYMAVVVIALYAARHDLAAIIRQAFSRSGTTVAPDEPMSYRTAILGSLAGLGFLTGFSYLAGMPVWLGVLFFFVYFAIAMAISRMRAELGPPTHDLHFIGPDQSLTTILGTQQMNGPTLGTMTLYYWFNRAYRCHPMPIQLEGLKMASQTRTSAQSLFVAMGIAAFVGVLATFWVTLHVSYKLGAAARITGWGSLGYGPEAYNRLAGWLATPLKPNVAGIWAMVVGFAIAGALMIARMAVFGWPLHALGFAISGGWSMMWAWLSLFVAWVLKSLVLRYGGLRGYRNGLPFFFGIILGDFVVGGSWTLLGLLFDIPIFSLWSG